MNVLQISTEDNTGGASRSAYRLHQAMLQQNVDCEMRVLTHQTANSRVAAGRAPRSFKQKVQVRLEQKIREFTNRNWHTDNPIVHSFGQQSAGIVDELNGSDADVLNLHWVPKLLSITDIGQLQKPIVWTLHDMWPFCGGEHYTPDFSEARFRVGYLEGNRPATERGPDLNRQAWEAKRFAWRNQNFIFSFPVERSAKPLDGRVCRKQRFVSRSKDQVIRNCKSARYRTFVAPHPKACCAATLGFSAR